MFKGCINETSGKYHSYRMSKSAVNMAFKCFSVELKESEKMVAIIHPGFVETNMT